MSATMRTPDELFRELRNKTSLQRDEYVKKLRGEEIQIMGELSDISSDHLRCCRFFPDISSSRSIHIMHQGDELRKQLLKYSYGDVVRMTLRFTGFSVVGEYDRWSFSLVSIVRVQTREAKEKRKSAIARLDSALDSFGPFCGFYYFYLLPVLSYGTFLVRALPDNHERITITLDLLVVIVLALIPVVNWLMCLLPLMFDNAAERRLFYSGLTGWAIVGGIGAVTGFLVLHARRWAISN
jgi:hypothetical protein